MLNADKYSIDNQKLIGRLLPFFFNGRKVFSFLLAIAHPLKSVHQQWKTWALSKITETMATSQPVVLKWYLKKILADYISNKNETFSFSVVEPENYVYVYEDKSDEEALGEAKRIWWSYEGDGEVGENINWLYTMDKSEVQLDESAKVVIVAPRHSNLISDDSYIRLIKQNIEKYLVYDFDYEVQIK